MAIKSYEDTEDMPAERVEACLNCGKDWDDHYGWACIGNPKLPLFLKDNIAPTRRYLTSDMLDSDKQQSLIPTIPAPAPNKEPPDLSDWRVWAGTPEPGYCACKCLKELCQYHKDQAPKAMEHSYMGMSKVT
jgi:hypothetical protein